MIEGKAPSFSDPELRPHVKAAVFSIFLLAIALIACGIWLEPELKRLGKQVYDAMGIPGLTLMVYLGDSVITPIPPDVALVIIQRSGLSQNAWWLVTWLGLVSAAAGFTGWYLGHKLRSTKFPRRIFGPKLETAESLMKKFGPIAVAIGALTPFPYSVTTWTAGIFNVPLRKMIIPTLLRVPRLWIYYWILDGAFRIGELMK